MNEPSELFESAEHRPAFLVGAAAMVLGLCFAAWVSWTCDDAFISFRYARNLVEGHGLVFNVGERVEGYSRGMRQKVVIACGLVLSPAVLLFDEPLTGLDPIGIRRMRDTIVGRARAGAAVLLSSHPLGLVQDVCTRVIIMHRGRKLADGSVDELAARADVAPAGSALEEIFLRVTGHDGSSVGRP